MIKEKSWLESKSIESAKYDEENSILTITFVGGNIYNYYAVPLEIWEEMILAPSVGKFLFQYIKGKFEYSKVDG